MDQRIEEIFGKSKIYDVESSLLAERSLCVSVFKHKNKTVMIVGGKIFCAVPSEVIPINDVALIKDFSDTNDVLKYIKEGKTDVRLEHQKKLIHILKVYNKLNKNSSDNLYRRESIEYLNF